MKNRNVYVHPGFVLENSVAKLTRKISATAVFGSFVFLQLRVRVEIELTNAAALSSLERRLNIRAIAFLVPREIMFGSKTFTARFARRLFRISAVLRMPTRFVPL